MTLGLDSALSGLRANANAISITSDNIANLETEGYHRKRVVQTTNTMNNGIGSGVRSFSVDRMINEAAETQYYYTKSNYHASDAIQNYADQIDQVIGDSSTGLQSIISDFMTTISDVANMPSSDAAKTVLMEQMKSLETQMHSLNDFLDQSLTNVNSQLTGAVDQLNSLASQVAEINDTIARTSDTQLGEMANILDHRDQLLSEMSKYAPVSSIERENGMVDVFVGTGLLLVDGMNAQQITPVESEYSDGAVTLDYHGQDVTALVSSGMIGGLLEYREDVHSDITSQIGLLAASIEASYNIQHRQGFTQTGATNIDFFQPFSHQAAASSNNAGAVVMTASFDYSGTPAAQQTRIGDLNPTRYEVEKVGANLEFTNLSTGAVTSIPEAPTMQLDGLEINISGAVPAGDKFLLDPFKTAGLNLKSAITDTTQIAQGTTPGGTNTDNTNMLAMVDIQGTQSLFSGTLSIQDQYTAIVGNVGSKAFSAEQSMMNSDVIMTRIQMDMESVSGVNMDEEAANLIKYQQAYQAMTQVISTSRDLFNTLITSMR